MHWSEDREEDGGYETWWRYWMPNTGSIGSMVYFYFTFWASPPYVPFVPLAGEETDLFFDDDTSNAFSRRGATL